MFPYRDNNPSATLPVVTIVLIALNCIAFVVELQQGQGLDEFVNGYGLTPSRVFGNAGPGSVDVVLPWEPEQHQVYSVPVWLTFFTSMFLHGGWLHLLGNMWYLWIFGDNVEDRMGHFKFLLFYLLCGLGAALAQAAANTGSDVPMVGASGAIAGVLGAYLIAFPYARVSTLIFLGFFITVVQMPAFVLLGLWFALQFFSGMGSMSLNEAGGVAWWAHVGGFVAGMALLFVFQKSAPQRRVYVYSRSR
jgi:membrane associated rhomboid family serine protease